MDLDLNVNDKQDRIISSFEEIEFAQKVTSLNNTFGGKLLIGINEKGKVVGVYPKDELENIPIVIANFCSKSLLYNSEVIEINNKLIIVLTILKTIKIAALSIDKSLEYYFRIEQNICVANKIIEKLWRFERENTGVSPCSTEDQEVVLRLINNHTLSQLYTKTKLSKSVVDITVSWLLFSKKIKMVLKENQVIYQHLS
jgi:predicted HTH transcriptional regulator